MRRKELSSLALGYLGAMLGLCCTAAFGRLLLPALPMWLRMLTMPPAYWLIALAPALIMRLEGDKPVDYGFSRNNIPSQLLTGLLIALGMSLAFTLLPHMLGFGEHVDNGHRYKYLWQFVYEFIYCVIAIGFTEEFVFRGFVYARLKSMFSGEMPAIIVSSVLFGLFHVLGGNIVQMLVTALLGGLFCLCRLKIKSCSTLSLIIAHGIYDALISLWASLLL